MWHVTKSGESKERQNFLEKVTPRLRGEVAGASQVTVVRERKVRENSACQHSGGNGVVVHGEKQAVFTSVRDKKWREVEAKRSRSQVREGLPCQILAQMVKNLPGMWETQVQSLDLEDPLEKGMATHSSILAWRILWTEEPVGLQSMGSQRVAHD